MKTLILFSFAILLFVSCTVIKREHLKGYYVDWNKRKFENDEKALKNISETGLVKVYVKSDNVIINESAKEEKNENLNLFFNYQIVCNEEKPGKLDILRIKKYNKILVKNNLYSKQVIFKNIQNSFNLKKQQLLEGKLQTQNKSGENQIVALLLCLFLGMLGVHSFYLGNKNKGLIQLAMFLVGLVTFWFIIGYLIWFALGIWVFIDFIRIIIGDLGPGW